MVRKYVSLLHVSLLQCRQLTPMRWTSIPYTRSGSGTLINQIIRSF